MTLSSLLRDSKVNIRSDNITVFYQTKEDLKGEFGVRKLLVKNISLGGSESAAFEIQSSVKMALKRDQLLSSNILLVGELTHIVFCSRANLNPKWR